MLKHYMQLDDNKIGAQVLFSKLLYINLKKLTQEEVETRGRVVPPCLSPWFLVSILD